MVLVETDFLVSLVFPGERHHGTTLRLLKTLRPIRLSPYALLELDLLIRAGRIRVKDAGLFFEKLGEVLAVYSVEQLRPDPRDFSIARRLREEPGLTYFDSLHGAAIRLGELLVSYDHVYGLVEGLAWIHPLRLAGARG